jgi:TorA maturation chaperone TorD
LFILLSKQQNRNLADEWQNCFAKEGRSAVNPKTTYHEPFATQRAELSGLLNSFAVG